MRAEPAAPVGRLTPRRAALVADETLARWAATLELGAQLRLGRGAEQTGGRATASILATTLEADERRARQAAMWSRISAMDVKWWQRQFLHRLMRFSGAEQPAAYAGTRASHPAAIT